VIGASGAVSALIGAYLALFPGARLGVVLPLGLFLEFVRVPAFLLIGLWVLLQVLFAYSGPAFGAVAWPAHIAGFLFGVVFALLTKAAIARRLRRTNDVLADLVFTDVPGRVAKALLDLADRFGRPVDDGLLVAHDLTQEELAQLVGASRETVNKALADFASRGWLRLEARAVLLTDVERLKRRAR